MKYCDLFAEHFQDWNRESLGAGDRLSDLWVKSPTVRVLQPLAVLSTAIRTQLDCIWWLGPQIGILIRVCVSL